MGSGAENNLETVAIKLLEPEKVTRSKIIYHVRRAKRLRIYWYILDSMERALLEAAMKTRIEEYRGEKIKSLLARLIAKIELHTMKGKVILAGLQRALSLTSKLLLGGLPRLLKWAREKLDYILYLGRSILTVELYFTPIKEYYKTHHG